MKFSIHSLFLGGCLLACLGACQAEQEVSDSSGNFSQENTFQLAAPIIKSSETLFSDSARIELSLGMPGVRIYYTLDGSEPTEQSQMYETPFYIKESCELKTRAVAEGWLPSEPLSMAFRHKGPAIARASLAKDPSSSYPGQGAVSLIDGQKGSANFRDGNWLGFDRADLVVNLDLGESRSYSKVVVSALEDPGSWIFFPESILVEYSEDGKNYQVLGEKQIALAEENTSGSQDYLELEVEEQTAPFLKVTIRRLQNLPEWHPGAADMGNAWLFVDEVMVE